MYIDDTIAAIATAPGEGGIGIVRISGENCLNIVNKVFRSKKGKSLNEYNIRTLVYGHIVDNDKVIDEVLAVYMKAPHTYTKEDVIEINCHGGFISVKKILELLLKSGARIADRGEFTKRAFLNGRIDLSQAEAVIDIIKAKTDTSYNIAQKQLEGGLSLKIRELRNKVTEILAQIEVSIDFPDEDIEHITYASLEDKSVKLMREIQTIYDSAESGKIMRDGLKTVIVGKPNVGKSSLLNAILNESRAIVTDIPGTTRDIIEEFVNIRGIPLKIIDTAGIRQTNDIVEKIGVEKSKESFESADLVIFVVDASNKLSSEDIDIIESMKEKKVIVLMNKNDLKQKMDENDIKKYMSNCKIIKISALEKYGIEQLENEIESMVYNGNVVSDNDIMITNVRHKDALKKALISIEDALKGIQNNLPLDFIEVDFKNIWDYLGEVSGDSVKEDLLDTIFRDFCIGK